MKKRTKNKIASGGRNIASRLVLYGLSFLLLAGASCTKNSDGNPPIEEDRWMTRGLADSTGNRYYVVATNDNRVQIRITDPSGTEIFREDCPTIEPEEIPYTVDSAFLALTAPSAYIGPDDASLSFRLMKKTNDSSRNYVQLLANINLSTKVMFTKKYKVENPLDWTFVMHNDGVAQWYQNTLLVREGTDGDILGGDSFMDLGSRGTQLLCYERDFSIRYAKDIDVSFAYYPRAGGLYIPISDTDRIAFGISVGLITRSRILVSVEDEWRGVRPVVWQVDLRQVENLAPDQQLKITEYSVVGSSVNTTYSIYDNGGQLLRTIERAWDLETGMPRTQLTP